MAKPYVVVTAQVNSCNTFSTNDCCPNLSIVDSDTGLIALPVGIRVVDFPKDWVAKGAVLQVVI